MSNFNYAMQEVWKLEHGDNPEKILHFNPKEKNYTFYGIYPYTKLKSHYKIREALDKKSGDTKQASIYLNEDLELYDEVLEYYRLNFYEPLGLNFIEDSHKATEIIVFAINVGMGRKKIIVKAIQKIVGAKVDGIMGVETIIKLNKFSDLTFDKLWDAYEISFYRSLVSLNSKLKWALKGWINRAKAV